MQAHNGPQVSEVLVNGKKCILSTSDDAITWWPQKKKARHNVSDLGQVNLKQKRIELFRLIGYKREFVHNKAQDTYKFRVKNCKKYHDKIRIYYARENNNESSGKFLKLAKLTIQNQAFKPKEFQSDDRNNNIKVDIKSTHTEANADKSGKKHSNNSKVHSAPPSCYASEGSSGHLSSLSSSSSSGTCSPSPSPIQVLDSDKDTLNQDNKIDPSSNELAKISSYLQYQVGKLRLKRPKRLLIFVNPYGGKGDALYIYKSRVKGLLDLAEIESTLIVTKYANHARETIEDPLFNIEYFDGVVCVGGDGMFSELMNGLLFRYNRDKILNAQLKPSPPSLVESVEPNQTPSSDQTCDETTRLSTDKPLEIEDTLASDNILNSYDLNKHKLIETLELVNSLGGIGQQFHSPPVPLGVIGAGSTDANSYGLIGTNDVITATLNIIIGNRIKIDACSIHTIDKDDILKFVSTFVAYGYFGDVIRESEKLRWLGPSRYDVTGANNLLKNRTYDGTVRILISKEDGSPADSSRCHRNCKVCWQSKETTNELKKSPTPSDQFVLENKEKFHIVERSGAFIGVNAAVTACRCPQTKKGFSPNNHLANGCVDLILVRPCSRLQYLQYLIRTGWTNKSAFDLGYVEAFRCRQFEFLAPESIQKYEDPILVQNSATTTVNSLRKSKLDEEKLDGIDPLDNERKSATESRLDNSIRELSSSWNVDGEILNKQSIRVKVNNQLLTVFGTGEPLFV